jgi:hypothetical protein
MRTRLDLLVICALAVYRLWRLIARDDLTARWREQFYNRRPPSATRAAGMMVWDKNLRQNVFKIRPIAKKTPKVSALAQAIDCPWCAGTWLSAALTIAVNASFGLTWPVAWFAALACLVGLLGRADAS